MTRRKTRGLPAGLENTRRRFERWRRRRTFGERIPDSLWASAVTMAGRHGVGRTARTLGLDHGSLKRRVDTQAAAAACVPGEDAGTTFVELPAPAQGGSGECVVELEAAGGAKMRVHLRGGEAPDLAALCRSFLEAEA